MNQITRVGDVVTPDGRITQSATPGGGGAVSSVANSDGTLTISPTTGAVVASRAALTGDVTCTAGSNVTAIANDVVTPAKLDDGSACSVLGRSANSTGDRADIAAITNSTFLSRVGNTLAFRGLTAGSSLGFDGSGGLFRGALSGVITAAAASNTTAFDPAVVTAAAQTVLDDATVAAMVDTLGGASSTGTGGLVRATSPTLVTPALGTPASGVLTNCTGLPTAGLVDDAVTYAKIQNVSATDKVLGRSTAGAGDVEEITCTAAGRALLDDANAAAQVTTLGLDNTKIAVIPYEIDGGGAVLTTGIKGRLEIPFACTINRVTMLADQSGSVVVDIWKDTYANYAPTDADSITASAPPTISAATKSQDSTLTGWTTSIAAGDILMFNVDSATTITKVTVSLKVTKT